ncbi:restriction endonuclease subunit S, partial [Bacteroides caecimuris]|uniref:restriction endonuclease subunit S n=1 Tax=Bacteroides caecimuris TaxID=1796613 RepID=UPI0026EE066F
MEEMTNIIPSMRFDEFKYSWKVTTLGEITCQYRESNKNVHHQNLLSLSYGKIVRKDIESKKGLLPASFDTYQIIKKDIIVFRVTDLQNDKKSLRVGISEEEGIITPAYVCMECDTRVVDPHYLYTLLHYYDDITKVYYKMGDGMRQTLAYSDLKELKVYLPNFPEQHKIVECFELLDKQIQISSKKIASLRQMKAASLQAMFPQKGETRPRVRFKGFEGEYSSMTASELFKTFDERNHPELPVLSACQDIRGMAPRSESGYDIFHDKSNEVTYKRVLPGQFVIHLRS